MCWAWESATHHAQATLWKLIKDLNFSPHKLCGSQNIVCHSAILWRRLPEINRIRCLLPTPGFHNCIRWSPKPPPNEQWVTLLTLWWQCWWWWPFARWPHQEPYSYTQSGDHDEQNDRSWVDKGELLSKSNISSSTREVRRTNGRLWAGLSQCRWRRQDFPANDDDDWGYLAGHNPLFVFTHSSSSSSNIQSPGRVVGGGEFSCSDFVFASYYTRRRGPLAPKIGRGIHFDNRLLPFFHSDN